MNERQYERLVANRRVTGGLRLDETRPAATNRIPVLARVLAAAAQVLQRREQAQAAWERIARATWHRGAQVVAVEGGTLVIAVESSALYYELTRRRADLQRQVQRLVPGVCAVRFVVAVGEEPGLTDAT